MATSRCIQYTMVIIVVLLVEIPFEVYAQMVFPGQGQAQPQSPAGQSGQPRPGQQQPGQSQSGQSQSGQSQSGQQQSPEQFQQRQFTPPGQLPPPIPPQFPQFPQIPQIAPGPLPGTGPSFTQPASVQLPLPPIPTFPATLPGGLQPIPTGIGSFPTQPGLSSQQTCVCVPNGACNTGPSPFDGSGLIDIRIVTNPSSIVTPNIVTPTTCATGLIRCCTPGPYQCGLRYPPVGGAPFPLPGQAPYGAYPWQAVLLGPGDVYQGSGILIDPLNVLTVAHRTFNFSLAPSTLRVRMGEWNAAGDTEPLRVQEFTVAKIFINSNFNAANLRNDIAVLRLATPVPLGSSPAITTGCLPVNSFVGQRCWVSGWGRNDFLSGQYQTIQKQVDVPILPQAQCQAALSATRLGYQFQYDANSFICAGGELGRDACTGDGGSPLVCQLGNRWFVAGLVAWGIGCGTPTIPGVYVNVANFLPWIQQTINTP